MIRFFYVGNPETQEVLQKRSGEFLFYTSLDSAVRGLRGFNRWNYRDAEIFEFECMPNKVTGDGNIPGTDPVMINELISFLRDKDEMIIGNAYEDICLTDYDCFSSGLVVLLEAWDSQKLIHYNWQDDERLFSDEEKRQALKRYLHEVADKL